MNVPFSKPNCGIWYDSAFAAATSAVRFRADKRADGSMLRFFTACHQRPLIFHCSSVMTVTIKEIN